VALSAPDPNTRKRFEHATRDYLSGAAGLDEVQTYSFDFDPLLRTLAIEPGSRLTLRNPISAEMPALRRSLVPGLVGVLEKNARAFDAIRVYEIGRVFHPRTRTVAAVEGEAPSDEPFAVQPTILGMLVAEPGHDPREAGLFFALKAVLLGLARRVARAVLSVAQGGVTAPWAHPARQARLLLDGRQLGVIAELHPLVQERLDVRQRAAVAEFDLDAWRASGEVALEYRRLPRYPPVFRDFAVVVREDVPAAAVRRAILAAAPELIAEVAFQSDYRGPGIGDGEKSLAWSVAMRHPDRTLADPEVREIETAIWRQLQQQVGGHSRA
jgi:phenylalanyl-tRNA synthetase beta chain